MTKTYIFTGMPGSGKSTLLLELESRGEYIIREAAEDVIKLEQAKGNERPWEIPGFQMKILNLQIQRISRIPSQIERVLFDRGIPDGLAYEPEGTETHKAIQRAIHRCDGIFLIEGPGTIQNTRVRREDIQQALVLERKLEEIYQTLGYQVPRIRPGPVEKRADEILKMLNFQAKPKKESKKEYGGYYNDLSDYGGLTGNG
jgi:predicted ATPase